MKLNRITIYKSILLLLLFSCLGHYSFAQSPYTKLAKSYSSVQYFYPNPALSELDWDKFLLSEVANILKNKHDLESAIASLVPDVSFEKKRSSQRLISPTALGEHLYYQHFGGIATPKGIYSEKLMESLIVGSDLKSFSMLRETLPISKAANHRIKLSFYAKYPSKNGNNGLITLNPGYRKNGAFETLHHRVFIEPNNEWKYYELDTIFCPDCPRIIGTFLKIIRPQSDTLLIDDLRLYDYETERILYENGFEAYDTLYQKFPSFNYFHLAEEMASRSTDKVSGDYSLQLIGYDSLSLYPQQNMDSLIQVQLSDDYWLQFPRFIPKQNKYNLEKTIKHYNKLKLDEFDQQTTFISDIIKAWSMIEHSYPYTELRNKIDADALLMDCISKVLENEDYNSTRHFQNLTYLLSAYCDPHLSLIWKNKERRRSPIIPQLIDGVYRIGQIYDEAYLSYFGKEIQSINDQSIDQWLDHRIYDKSAINSVHLINTCLKFQFYDFDSNDYTFTFSDGSELKIEAKDAVQNKPLLKYFALNKTDTIYTMLNGQAKYLNIPYRSKLSLSRKKSLQYVKDSLSSYPYLVLDFRNGNFNHIYSHILELKEISNTINTKPDCNSIIDAPFQTAFDCQKLNIVKVERKQKNTFYFNPKIIALVDEQTKSAPERRLLPLYESGLVTLIGKQTAGTAAFVNKIILPSNIKMTFTTGKTTYKDGRSYQNNGMVPHFIISDSSSSSEDLFLEKAKEILLEWDGEN